MRRNAWQRAAASVAVAVALLTSAGCSSAPSVHVAEPVDAAFPAHVEAGFQQAMDETRTELGFPGAIAGVWNPQGSWIGVTGTRGAQTQAAPQRVDHTRIGSLTKTFTGISLLQQVDKGLLSLDDPIGKYVPGVPNADTATLRMLASMTSGIPAYTSVPAFLLRFATDPTQTFTPRELIDYIADEPALFPAGTKFDYSNTNTVLLGMVIEQVTGKSISQVFSEEIFTPLGLTGTSFPATSAAIAAPHLDGLTDQGLPEDELKNATDWNPSWGFTAGEMISRLDDLRVWGEVLGGGSGLLSAELEQARMASFDSAPPTGRAGNLEYGLGFGSFDGWLGHNGSLPGYTTYVVHHPETSTTIVVLANSDIHIDGKSPADTIGQRLQAVVTTG